MQGQWSDSQSDGRCWNRKPLLAKHALGVFPLVFAYGCFAVSAKMTTRRVQRQEEDEHKGGPSSLLHRLPYHRRTYRSSCQGHRRQRLRRSYSGWMEVMLGWHRGQVAFLQNPRSSSSSSSNKVTRNKCCFKSCAPANRAAAAPQPPPSSHRLPTPRRRQRQPLLRCNSQRLRRRRWRIRKRWEVVGRKERTGLMFACSE